MTCAKESKNKVSGGFNGGIINQLINPTRKYLLPPKTWFLILTAQFNCRNVCQHKNCTKYTENRYYNTGIDRMLRWHTVRFEQNIEGPGRPRKDFMVDTTVQKDHEGFQQNQQH